MNTKEHERFLQLELQRIRELHKTAVNQNSQSAAYYLGMIDGMVVVMSTLGLQTTNNK